MRWKSTSHFGAKRAARCWSNDPTNLYMKATAPRKASVPQAPLSRKLEPVIIKYVAPTAQSVGVAGTFNHWNVQPLKPDGNGGWSTVLELDPGRYEYLLVVDGQWHADPAVSEAVTNPYGGLNSVLMVTNEKGP